MFSVTRFATTTLSEPRCCVQSVPSTAASGLLISMFAQRGYLLLVATRLHPGQILTWYSVSRKLGTACQLYNVAYLFDNEMTVVFAFVMSVWGRRSQ